jgi:hypothetical protein
MVEMSSAANMEGCTMSNAKKKAAPNQKPAAKVTAAQRKRVEDSQVVKDPNAQLSQWAFSLLSFILSVCLARIVKAGLMTAESAEEISLDAKGGRTAWQVIVNPKVASKAKVERFEEGEAKAQGVINYGLALAESKDSRLSAKVSARKLHEAAYLVIRSYLEPANGDADQQHLNNIRTAMLLRPEAAEGNDGKKLAKVICEQEADKLLDRACGKVGANPYADVVKSARVQSGKKCLTINTDSKEFGSLTTRSMKPERAAAVRAMAPEFLLGIDHIEALAEALVVDPKALRSAIAESGALRLAIKADAEKVETVERKPSDKEILREALDANTLNLLDRIDPQQ